ALALTGIVNTVAFTGFGVERDPRIDDDEAADTEAAGSESADASAADGAGGGGPS
ncbi:MAG: hypothetical protein H5T80_07960, partial [Dietzia sp.]|nr:hypothetical protein [Dietzia sp.]